MRKLALVVMGLGLLLMMSSCAVKPTNPEELRIYEQNNDPLEPLNRSIFTVNLSLDKLVIKPAAKGYRFVVPKVVRTGVSNFFNNLKQPIYFLNSLLQGDPETAGITVKRFAANTFWGFFGIFDTASYMDIPAIKRDFGETLAVWGVEKSGPYLMLPILGPSTVRDAIGLGVDSVMAPIDWALRHEPFLAYSLWGLDGFQKREQAIEFLDNLEKSSMDYYAATRSMYQQNRQSAIQEVLGNSGTQTEDLSYDFDFPEDEADEGLEEDGLEEDIETEESVHLDKKKI